MGARGVTSHAGLRLEAPAWMNEVLQWLLPVTRESEKPFMQHHSSWTLQAGLARGSGASIAMRTDDLGRACSF